MPYIVRDTPITTTPNATAYFSRYFDHDPEESGRALAAISHEHVQDLNLRIYA